MLWFPSRDMRGVLTCLTPWSNSFVGSWCECQALEADPRVQMQDILNMRSVAEQEARLEAGDRLLNVVRRREHEAYLSDDEGSAAVKRSKSKRTRAKAKEKANKKKKKKKGWFGGFFGGGGDEEKEDSKGEEEASVCCVWRSVLSCFASADCTYTRRPSRILPFA